MKKILSLFALLLSLGASAQNVGIGTTTPNASARLDVTDTTAGILIPRMTADQRAKISSPANGLLVFTTTDSSFYFYHNGWKKLLDSAQGWNTTGNAGTDFTKHFFGTTDATPLRIKTFNRNSGQINPLQATASLGYAALDSVSESTVGNTAIGQFAACRNKTGNYNSSLGVQSLLSLASGSYNTAFGSNAGVLLKTGNRNTFIGMAAGSSKTDLESATAIGFNARVEKDYCLVLGNSTVAVGVGVSKPFTSFTNSDSNVVGGNGYGVGGASVGWAMNEYGYVQGLFNRSTIDGANGLAIKTAGNTPNHVLLDLSTGPYQSLPGTPVMAVRADGTMGLGTNVPAVTFHVSTSLGADRAVALLQNNNASASGSQLRLTSTNGSAIQNWWVGNGGKGVGQAKFTVTGSDKNRLVIDDANGFVGVGTNNPAAPLHAVFDGSGDKTGLLLQTTNASNQGSLLKFLSTNGTASQEWYIGSGGYGTPQGRFTIGGSNAARLVVDDANGNVGIGVSDPHAPLHVSNFLGGKKLLLYEDGNNDHQYYGLAIDPSTLRYQSGNEHAFFSATSTTTSREIMRLYNSGAVRITGAVTALSFTSSSDARLKKDFAPLQNAMPLVMQLKPVYYFWKKDEFPDRNFSPARQLGFSAQEVEALFPELVQTDAQGYKSVDYSRLTPVLVQAVKEQQARLDEQEKALKALVEEVKALKEEFTKR